MPDSGPLGRRPWWRNRFFLLSSVGVGLWLAIATSEYLLTPQAMEPVARLIYRLAFFAVLPFRILVLPLLPEKAHHWSVLHTTVVCLGAPFFYDLVWRVVRRYADPMRILRPPEAPNSVEAAFSRRQFMAASTLSVSGLALGGTGSYATLIEPQQLRVRRYALSIKGLPEGLDGARLIHVSDTHYGPFVSLSFLRHVVDRVNALEGDLIVLTGDYVHRSSKAIEPGIGLFQKLKSRYGAVGVLGNHDHWEGAEDCRRMFEGIGIPLVDNRHIYLRPNGLTETQEDGDALCVAGVGDLWEDDVSFSRALEGVAPHVPRIVLSHNPDVAETMDDTHRVDAMFSGHTHGGQVRLPVLGAITPSKYGEKYLGGLCTGPRCPVIVSRGIGLGGIPIRFRVAPEIGVVTLKRS